ncbi:hypothetical protein BgAZ_103530 [Babesia gibsoni]|uniref:Signal peptide containing protein n=1 Tax=Babesia gibsoni TaxID=33632 RepID=A0AAD8UT16_BABGI|nr:hypothetical protein BgAZ_103520 [Babesia gibsoni]KAK1444447.1 hypothetical protein BgAZ_103530 [Babesia gibsoni]
MDWSLFRCALALFVIPFLLDVRHVRGQPKGKLIANFDTERPSSHVVNVVVDLLDINRGKGYDIVTSEFGEGIHAISTPAPECIITKIFYGKNQVFVPNPEKREVIERFVVDATEEDIVVTIRVSGRDVKFGLVGEGFVPLTPKEFNYRIARMGKPCNVDLSRRDTTEEVAVRAVPLAEITTHNYVVQKGFKAVKVVDKDITLWEGDVGEFAKDIKLTRVAGVHLVSLMIERPSGSKTDYYIGDAAGYHTITPEEFFKCFVSKKEEVQAVLSSKKDSTLRGTT